LGGHLPDRLDTKGSCELSGRLFVIATPIGNLNDLTDRAKEVLHECDCIFAEDTRVSVKLLNHLGLKKPLISCHEFNESKRSSKLEELSAQGASVAVVSDAGTPLVSDPGYRLLQKAIELGMQVIPIPGPSAFLLALVASGLPCERFAFEGFLPQKKSDRKRHLQKLQSEERTMIFYVPPHDQSEMFQEMLLVMGDRQVCLAREITKLHEEFWRGGLAELCAVVEKNKFRGECVLVIQGAPPVQATKAAAAEVTAELDKRLAQGQRLKEASAELAQLFGWSKSDVYRLGINNQDKQQRSD